MAKEYLQKAVSFEKFKVIHMNNLDLSFASFISVQNNPSPEASHPASRSGSFYGRRPYATPLVTTPPFPLSTSTLNCMLFL